jgi:branched-chain amino acid transport system substrate-binding protein
MRHRRWCSRTLCGLAVIGLLAVGITSGVAGAQAANAPGVTDKSVKIGYISSTTGVAATQYARSAKACQARIDAQNAKGGVNGRKIDLQVVDDASSGANLTGAQDLVQNRNVFAVVDNSAFGFLTWRYLLSQKVPEIGSGADGTYYGQKGNESIFSGLGDSSPIPGLTYDFTAKVMKQLGATKTAAVGYAASPSSAASAEDTQKYGATSQGLNPVYTNTTLDFGSTDVGSIVLGVKNSGADALYMPLDGNTNLAIVQGLQQNGVNMKANILASGYGQGLLDSPVAQTMTPHDVVLQSYKPVELKNDPAVKQFQDNLKKYAGITGVPDFGIYTGYIDCDMAITGLQQAGKNPTRQGFVDGLRKLNAYNGAALTCAPFNLSTANYGKISPTACSWFVYVKNGKFVVMNNGKPYTGKLVGDPKLLTANKTGTTGEVTTTTAAPAP